MTSAPYWAAERALVNHNLTRDVPDGGPGCLPGWGTDQPDHALLDIEPVLDDVPKAPQACA